MWIDHILKEFMSMIYVATVTASYIQIRVRTIISTITFILLSLKNNTKELLHGVTETPSKLYTKLQAISYCKLHIQLTFSQSYWFGFKWNIIYF